METPATMELSLQGTLEKFGNIHFKVILFLTSNYTKLAI